MAQTNQDKATMKENESPMSFNQALGEVIKNLKGQPLLLFVLGAGLLFLMAATQIPSMSTICGPLLILFVLGIVIWGFLETQKLTHGKMQTGNVKIAKNVSAENSEIETGGISASTGAGRSSIKTGDVNIQPNADLKGAKIKTGEIKLNTISTSKKDDKKS